ncbi:MAG: CBS domain-containing protein [Myxococcota bacterium]
MGELNVKRDLEPDDLRRFMKRLLRDVRAFEKMLDLDMIETGVRRIGAEQELFLVDSAFKAAPLALKVLDKIEDPRFTTELAMFNIEFNLDPQLFGGDCLSRMEQELCTLLEMARKSAHACEGEVLMTGILPTIQQSDLNLSNMTPLERYYALNEAMTRLRNGQDYEFHIKGADDFMFRHDSVMLEACNTSFQVHFQVGHREFAKLYNTAQAVSGPVLAAATNSPLLLGKRLWYETRIALFQQSIDTRSVGQHLRDLQPRVTFGNRWVERSVMEIFKEDISRFRVILGTEADEDPFEVLDRGEAPSFGALRLHNGTVYRWNRPCYGISNGKPHLRIENRILPSGPTPIDEIANAALWLGLMNGVIHEYDDITTRMSFDDARTNFLRAARNGLASVITWVDGRQMPARELLADELLPLARQGLEAGGIVKEDIERYLGVIEGRVTSAQTGSMWMLHSLSTMQDDASSISERMSALASATLSRQRAGIPVHQWPLAQLSERSSWDQNYLRVSQYMQTDLFTVGKDELVELVASVMDWHRVQHILVEDSDHHLVGVVTQQHLLKAMIHAEGDEALRSRAVSKLMEPDPITITPDTLTLHAIRLMRKHSVSCLPVVQNGKLVGMITERDFLKITRDLLEERLATST